MSAPKIPHLKEFREPVQLSSSRCIGHDPLDSPMKPHRKFFGTICSEDGEFILHKATIDPLYETNAKVINIFVWALDERRARDLIYRYVDPRLEYEKIKVTCCQELYDTALCEFVCKYHITIQCVDK